jgi:hypothetical protein
MSLYNTSSHLCCVCVSSFSLLLTAAGILVCKTTHSSISHECSEEMHTFYDKSVVQEMHNVQSHECACSRNAHCGVSHECAQERLVSWCPKGCNWIQQWLVVTPCSRSTGWLFRAGDSMGYRAYLLNEWPNYVGIWLLFMLINTSSRFRCALASTTHYRSHSLSLAHSLYLSLSPLPLNFCYKV